MGAEAPAGVTIVAYGHTVRPYLKEIRQAGEVWAINNSHAAHDYLPDRIIAMDDLERDEPEYPRYVREIVHAGVPVYTATAYPKWDKTVAYPLREVMDSLGLRRRLAQAVFSNTCCYALALALHEKRDPIRLYGFDFERPDCGTLVEGQRMLLKEGKPDWFVYYFRDMVRWPTEPGIHGLTFLLGLAHERGIEVHFPRESTLMDLDRDPFFYGYQDQPEID